MTSLLLPSAVTLLAHKRLADAVEALDRKVNSDVADVGRRFGAVPVAVNPTERRVLALATHALAMFQAGEPVDAPARLQVGPGLGRFALLGSAGFELPGYADLLAPGGGWVADTLRRGTPDPNLSRVVVGTTQLAIRAGALGLQAATKDRDRDRIRAFSMGMLSAAASGIVLGPVLRGLEAQRSKREWSRHRPALDIAAAEARVRAELLGGGSGAAAMWQRWWPASGDVPDALLSGLAGAIDEVYAIAAARPHGFKDFEDAFQPGNPLTAGRLRDAYRLMRQDTALGQWSWGGWYAALAPVLLMPSIGLIIVRALPRGGFFFTTATPVDEGSVYEALTVGFGLGALMPFGYSMWLWTVIPEQTRAFVNALVLFIARSALIPTMFATLGASPGVRWGVLFTLLFGADVYAAVNAIVEAAGGNAGTAFLFTLQTLPAATASLLLGYAALMKAMGVDSDLAFWLVLLLFTAVSMLAIGLPVSWALSRTGGILRWFVKERPELPLLDALSNTAAADPAALALLFDDATLWHEPGREPPDLTDLRYPAGPRALVRLWWTGAGALQITHDDHTVTFKKADGSTLPVDLPPGTRTAADLAGRLKTALPGLEAEVLDAADPLYDLPFPHTFGDPGDSRPTLAEHDARRADFLPVGTSRETAYLLPHAPRVELTTAYGAGGPSRSPFAGVPLVPGRTLGDVDDSAAGLAADLAVLLAMGAAPSLKGAPVTVAAVPNRPAVPGSLDRVYQVFRQWNLDERRVNEWRMLVAGGAESEKAELRAERDAAMRPADPDDPAAGPYSSRAPDGERVATAMGWIPVWRAWLRMAADPLSDTAATTPRPYTPVVAFRDGRRLQPTNQQLTDAVRFLLDLS